MQISNGALRAAQAWTKDLLQRYLPVRENGVKGRMGSGMHIDSIYYDPSRNSKTRTTGRR